MNQRNNEDQLVFLDFKTEGFPKASAKMYEIITAISLLNKEAYELAEDIKSKVLTILKKYVDDITLIYDDNNQNLIHLIINDNKFLVLKVVIEAYYLELDKNVFYNWFTMESKESLTPLDLAAQKGNEEIINYMFEILSKTDEKILKLDCKRNSVFHNAALKNKVYPILFFYEKLQIYFPNMKIIDNPNSSDITPLQYACYQKHIQIADLLLDLGADINTQDKEGKSVLIYAVYSNSFRLVKKLLLRGADKTLRDNKGNTAYDVAKQNEYNEIAKILQKRNCFSKYACNALELGSIRGIRNDIKTTYFFIIYFMFIAYFFLYFNPVDIKLQNNADNNTTLSSFFDTALYVSIGIALTCSTLAFLFFVFFTMIHRRYNNEHIKSNMENTFLELYNDSKAICVKCKRQMLIDTLHCLVCDICVDKWDHHCFWLNTCINSENKKLFHVFLCMLLIGVIANMIFSSVYITALVLMSTNDYVQLSIWGFFLFVFSYIFIFVYLPFLCPANKQEDNNATRSDYDINLIDRSNQEKTTFVL